jgi:PKD repeat protein
MKSGFVLITFLSIFIFQACKKKETEKTLVIDFTASKTDILAGDSITFHPSSNLYPVNFSWTFEGGNPSNSYTPTPTIVYSNAGQYSVSLHIKIDTDGPEDTKTKQNYIIVH